MSTSVGLFALLSLLARAVWISAQENDCSTIEWALQPDDFMHEALEYTVENAWKTMTREDQVYFVSKKNQLLDIINGARMDDERLRKVVQSLEEFAPDAYEAKKILLSQPVQSMWITFSNLCLYLNCAIERGFLAAAKRDCGWVTTTTTLATTPSTTTTKAPGPYPGWRCSKCSYTG
ncbi:hypothetical protein AAVH_29539 [Aphelenchoides avenae]|nr:hypothetical protein AAVH_35352 [Aphelenchus avenae]KAH7703289.1 hypothetical protein AAVH_29539 [Aphelenchus avenae]